MGTATGRRTAHILDSMNAKCAKCARSCTGVCLTPVQIPYDMQDIDDFRASFCGRHMALYAFLWFDLIYPKQVCTCTKTYGAHRLMWPQTGIRKSYGLLTLPCGQRFLQVLKNIRKNHVLKWPRHGLAYSCRGYPAKRALSTMRKAWRVGPFWQDTLMSQNPVSSQSATVGWWCMQINCLA